MCKIFYNKHLRTAVSTFCSAWVTKLAVFVLESKACIQLDNVTEGSHEGEF